MSPEAPQESEREPIAANGRGQAHAAARLRIVRGFAVFAALLMVLTAFGVVSRTASADVASALTSQSAGPSGTAYGPGTQVSPLPGGGVQSSNLATFQRWDGVYLPWTDLNESTGNWTYRVQTTAASFTISRLGLSFMQAKVPAAIYDFRPDRIKETLVVNSSFPTVILSPSISIPFSTAYGMAVSGASISLFDAGGNAVWRTAPFEAWDSAVPAHAWSQPISYIGYTSGLLALILNTDMLGQATYPLFVDPTWTLSSASGWGASTFQNATIDHGDGSVKIGWLADNFNDNANNGWTTTGTVTFSNGAMSFGLSSGATAGSSWSDQQIQFQVQLNAKTTSGVTFLYFRNQDSSNYCNLYIYQLGSNSRLELDRSSSTSPGYPGSEVLLSIPYTFSTTATYVAKVVAEGNTYTLTWSVIGGATNSWTVTDPFPPSSPISGPIQLGAAGAAKATIDNVRVWNTNAGSITTPLRDAGTNRPLQTEVLGTVDAYNQAHIQIRSNTVNSMSGPFTNVKADVATGILYNEPNQTQLEYYQLQITLTTGTNTTPVLTQVSTNEGPPPTLSPTANTGYEPWYPYAGNMVNLVSGNLYYTTTDLSFQGKGLVLALMRSYNSFLASASGPFGYGWTFNYGQSLAINVNGNVTWDGPDGSQFLFVAKGTTGGFSPPSGVPDRLVKNSDGTYTLSTADGGNEHFDSSGKLLSIADKNGNALTLAYSSGRTPLLQSVTDGAGKALTFAYDKNNHIVSATDPASRKVTYGYTGDNADVDIITDPLGNSVKYSYGGVHLLAALTDSVGKEVYFNYDTSTPARVTKVGLAKIDIILVYSFNEYVIAYPSATTRTITNARGYTTTITLNAAGNAILISGPSVGCSCDTGGNTSSYVWDGEMNKITHVDGRGDVWSSTYGFRNNMLTATDPGGNVSSQGWLEMNNATRYFVLPSSTTTSRGFKITLAYDSKGNLIATTDPGGNTTQYGYDANGFLNKTVSARGFTTWSVYNASGWLVKMTDPMNDVTQYAYDALGRQTTATSPLGFVTSTAYDADSRPSKVTDPLGNFTTYGYDARGDLTQVTDSDGLTTTYTINVTNGKDQAIKDSGGINTTSYGYDLRNNLASVKDANQHTTAYTYDAFDRLTKVTTPLGYVTSYVYDPTGNRLSRTDGNGYTTKYAYDKLNRLVHTYYPGSPVYSSPQTLNYTYDKDGNLVSATGFGYTETRSYDKSDRLVSTTFNYGTFSSTETYTYDQDGNRATMTLKDSSTTLTKYFYDKADRLTGILDSSGRNTTFTYDRNSRQTAVKDPNGIVQTSLYDKASRLTTMYTNNSAGTNTETLTYGYDKAAYRTSQKDVAGSTTTTTTYAYDKQHRLYSTVQGTSTTTDTFDAVGNVVKEVAGTTTTYAYDADNENTFANYTGGTSWAYGYDKDGNRVDQENGAHGSVTGFNYDYENRLIAVVRGIVIVCSYTYAPTGEQVTDTCAVAPDMVYDSASPGGSSNLAADYSSTGARQDQYLQANSVDTPVEMLQGSTYYGYQVDGLGSVKKVTDVNGNTAQSYTYDAWGNTVANTSLANPFQFAARPIDSATGLYNDRARSYDPSATGGHRFLSQDPMGGGYTYAGDSPANFVDPSGMSMAPPPEPCNNCGPPPAPSGPPPPPPPKPINPLKVIICAASILAFIGSIVVGFLGLYIDLNAIAGGLYIASMGWGLDLPGILGGGVANIGSWLQLFLDVAIYAWEYASRFIPWWDLLWEGPAEALKLNPVGVAVEAAFLGIEIALSLPGLVSACSDL